MIHATIPAVFCIAGALVYALSANAKGQELGRLAYGAGLLIALFTVAREGLVLP